MKRSVFCVLCSVLLALVVGACSSTPKFPEPAADSGQVLVKFEGKPRKGVSGPKTTEERGEYSISRVSVESGQVFERVDYDSIEDVVVIVKGADAAAGAKPRGDSLEVGKDGFNRVHLLMQPGGTLTVRNSRDTPMNIVGASGDDFFEVRVPANSSASVAVPVKGDYEIFSDEDESLSAFMWVTPYAAWIGNSEDPAFFDRVKPGDYTVTVHAPRLPCWYGKIKVAAGKREPVTAELTVNNLHSYGE